jgi:SHS2 domain-containing protein
MVCDSVPITGAIMRYTLIDHTADFGIHVFGENQKALFEQAGLAMFELLVDTGTPGECRQQKIAVQGSDWPDLLVNWLRELLYLWTDEENILRSIAVAEIAPYRISAWVDLEPFQAELHPFRNEIKAVTYHQVQAGPEGDHWEAKIIFDV